MSTSSKIRLARLVEELAVALHTSGATAGVIERRAHRLAEHFGSEASILASPTGLWLQVGDVARVVRLPPASIDLARLTALTRWQDALSTRRVPAAANGLKRASRSRAQFGPRAQQVGFALSCGLAGMLIGGTVTDTLAPLLIGDVLRRISERLREDRWTPLRMLLLALVAGTGAHLSTAFGGNATAVAFASLIVFVPGLGLTTALAEIASGHTNAGTSRLMGVVVELAQLAAGIAAASTLPLPPVLTTATPIPAEWMALVPLLAPANFAVVLNARRKQLPLITVVSCAAFYVATAMPGPTGAALAAFAVGIASRMAHHHLRIPHLAVTVPSILLLVPGTIGVRGLGLLLQNDVVGGVVAATEALTAAGALALGLLTALALVPASSNPDTASAPIGRRLTGPAPDRLRSARRT